MMQVGIFMYSAGNWCSHMDVSRIFLIQRPTGKCICPWHLVWLKHLSESIWLVRPVRLGVTPIKEGVVLYEKRGWGGRIKCTGSLFKMIASKPLLCLGSAILFQPNGLNSNETGSVTWLKWQISSIELLLMSYSFSVSELRPKTLK